ESATFPRSEGPGADAAYWPSFLGWIILALSAALLADTVFKRIQAKRRAEAKGTAFIPEPGPFNFKSRGMLHVYGLCAIFLVFSLLLHYFNFTAASVVLIPCCMRLLGERRLWMIAALTAGVPLLIWVIFAKILGIMMP
ncbi:MAG: tripartite tricarboxylate transporter TctB family protein, partial [Planctomycetota bacterium]|nr:tripartite tricarboxylate transporter TctB family protein [Planctomycetota bacterium]